MNTIIDIQVNIIVNSLQYTIIIVHVYILQKAYYSGIYLHTYMKIEERHNLVD